MEPETRELEESRHKWSFARLGTFCLPLRGLPSAWPSADYYNSRLDQRCSGISKHPASRIHVHPTRYGRSRPRDYHSLGDESSPTATVEASDALSNIRSRPEHYAAFSMEMPVSLHEHQSHYTMLYESHTLSPSCDSPKDFSFKDEGFDRPKTRFSALSTWLNEYESGQDLSPSRRHPGLSFSLYCAQRHQTRLMLLYLYNREPRPIASSMFECAT